MKSLFKWHSIQENVNAERGGRRKRLDIICQILSMIKF